MKKTIFSSTVVELVVVSVLWLAHGCGDGTVLTKCVKDGDCAAIPGGCCRAGLCEAAAVCNPEPFCGNGIREPGEGCDGSDLGGQSCQTLGYPTGELRCLSNCLFDVSRCRAANSCGDGKVDPDEECDGSDLRGKTCESLSFSGGTLVCAATCTFDRSDCTSEGCTRDSDCGPGKLCLDEQCVTGNCRASTECIGGQVCKDHTCQACGTSRDCSTGQVCCQGACNPGDCCANEDCNGRVTGWKAVEDHWMDRTADTVKRNIDISKSYGANVYALYMRPAYESEIVAGNDYVRVAMDYAHSKEMKFKIIFDSFEYYTSDKTRDSIKTEPAARAAYLADIEWVMQRYPELDAFELEEPTFDDISKGAENRDFLNSLFTDAKDIVTRYHSFDSFLYGFNSPSNSRSNVDGEGIDVEYINNNRLFNAYLIQNPGGGTVSGYQQTYENWDSWLPNLEIINAIFVTWSSIYNSLPCNNTGSIPECWNQGLFDQLKSSNERGQAMEIFILGRLAVSASMWPKDTTPGATAGEKVKYIWDTKP